MPGIGLVTALAFSLLGAEPVWPDLNSQPPATGGGENDAALVVAIEHYACLPQVAGAVELGLAWYLYLGTVRNIPTVTLLKDSEATPNKIRNALDAVAERVKPGGRAWVVFIGHGAPSQDGRDGVLVGAMAQADQVDFFPQTVPRGEVVQRLRKATPGALPPVLVIDACFSGTDTEGKTLVKGAQFAVSQDMLEEEEEEATLLTAGRARDIAGQLPGAQHPAFSYLLLGALRGWGDRDGDGVVTALEAVQYAQDAILMLDSGRQQKPQFHGPDQALTARLQGTALEKGPDLKRIRVDMIRGAQEGAATGFGSRASGSASASGESDSLDRKLADVERATKERLLKERLEAEAQEQTRQEQAQRVEASWKRVMALADAGVPNAMEALEAFLAAYSKDPHAASHVAEARKLMVRLALAQAAGNSLVSVEQVQQLVVQLSALIDAGNCAMARLMFQNAAMVMGYTFEMQVIDALIKSQCEDGTGQSPSP